MNKEDFDKGLEIFIEQKKIKILSIYVNIAEKLNCQKQNRKNV